MRQDAPRHTDAWARSCLPAYGFLGALYVSSITQELAVSSYFFAYSRSVILFGLLPVFHGLGMFASSKIARRLPPGSAQPVLGLSIAAASAISLILALQLSLKMPGFVALLTATLLSAAATTFLHGAIFASILSKLAAQDRGRIGRHLAGSLLGIAAAALLRGKLIAVFGVNALVLTSGLAAAALAFLQAGGALRISAALAAIFIIPAALPIDRTLESFRNTMGRLQDMRWCYSELQGLDLNDLETLVDAWSPLCKVNIYRVRGTDVLFGAANYDIVWAFNPQSNPLRDRIFEAISLKGPALAIAMGSGFPLLSVPKPLRHAVTAVEMDPLVARFFSEHPELNRGVYRESRLVTIEGRSLLDRDRGLYDAIFLDLPGLTAALFENAVYFEDFLFTREAVARYRSLLTPDGIVAAFLLKKQSLCAIPSFAESDLHYRAFGFPGWNTPNKPPNQFRLVLAAKDPARLERAAAFLLREPSDPRLRAEDLTPPPGEAPFPALTDDHPFAPISLNYPLKDFRELIKKYAWPLAWAACAGLLAGLLRSGSLADRGRIVYFFLIGIGFTLLQATACAKFRSLFGDPLSTNVNVTMLLLGFAALGSACSDRWRGKTLTGVALVAAGLACGAVAASQIPFASYSNALHLVSAAAIIAPPAFIAGFFFPIGVAHSPHALLGRCFLADALGTGAGFLIFYELYWSFGLSWNIAPLCICYIAAASIGGLWLQRD